MSANTVFWMCAAGIEFMLLLVLATMASNRIREAEEETEHYKQLYEHEHSLRTGREIER